MALGLRLIQEQLGLLNNGHLLIHLGVVTVKVLAGVPSPWRVLCTIWFLHIDFLDYLAHLVVEGLLYHVVLLPQVVIEVFHADLRSV
jgi:hypothetical protein